MEKKIERYITEYLKEHYTEFGLLDDLKNNFDILFCELQNDLYFDIMEFGINIHVETENDTDLLFTVLIEVLKNIKENGGF